MALELSCHDILERWWTLAPETRETLKQRLDAAIVPPIGKPTLEAGNEYLFHIIDGAAEMGPENLHIERCMFVEIVLRGTEPGYVGCSPRAFYRVRRENGRLTLIWSESVYRIEPVPAAVRA